MSTARTPLSIFLFGATGFIGGELLISLSQEFPDFPITALVRNAKEREAALKTLHPNITAVEGALASDEIIQAESAKADIVINVASSDHLPSVESTIKGLKKRAQANPARAPIYIHTSGMGITSDNSRGELVAPETMHKDINFKLSDVHAVTHALSDEAVVAAGTDKDVPIRTMIVFPAWVYGVGGGVQKITLPVRLYIDFAKTVGQAGTYGLGKNAITEIHVKDVASAIIVMLKAALEGKADEGADGFYFASYPRMVNMQNINTTIGDTLHAKGVIPKGGCAPLPDTVADSLGPLGWSMFGSSTWGRGYRLAKFGWDPVHTKAISVLESLPAEVAAALEAIDAVKPPDYSQSTM
ncbi:NAD(P)-binding protein [Hymenopellis radicata]|nr:NAD(P)-binding protein [Hymenopellis radicata]